MMHLKMNKYHHLLVLFDVMQGCSSGASNLQNRAIEVGHHGHKWDIMVNGHMVQIHGGDWC